MTKRATHRLVVVERYEVEVCETAAKPYGAKELVGAAIRGPEDVLAVCRKYATKDREHFVRLDLNARHEVMGVEIVSVGSLNASIVHPREVFKGALMAGAAAIVVVHNHPSGDPEPSEEDLSITKRLVQVGEMVGIAVLDHVILAKRGLVSLRARQLL